MDRFLESPAVAVGFIIFVVYLVLFYFAQREKANVARMRGPRRFSPSWSSGRTHRRRRSSARREGFKPQWTRRDELDDAPPARDDGKPSSDRG